MKNSNEQFETRRAKRLRKEAKRMLTSPYFFSKFLSTVKKIGLVGEERNALALYIVSTSRLLDRPLNAFLKGASSTGKNWIASRVLLLMPKNQVREITNASARAFDYAGEDFRHRVVYVQERSQTSGTMHPTRLLISEGSLVRMVTVRGHGDKFTTRRYVTTGPIASICTSTKDQLQIDDETRHISLWTDESEKQTRRIVTNYLHTKTGLSDWDLEVWRYAQQLVAERAAKEITLPDWFGVVADELYVGDERVRRYWPAFVEACRTVALIRSFKRSRRNVPLESATTVHYSDFAIAAVIFDSVFVESLRASSTDALQTRHAVGDISREKGGAPVRAKQLAAYFGVSEQVAYKKLREAESGGAIDRVNTPTKANVKLYLPTPRPDFLPDPQELFQRVRGAGRTVSFVHPLNGKRIKYRRTE